MDHMTVGEAAEKWNITERWVQKLCGEDRIKGAEKPIDGQCIPIKTNGGQNG